MGRIKLDDIPQDRQLTEEEVKKVFGGASFGAQMNTPFGRIAEKDLQATTIIEEPGGGSYRPPTKW